MKMINDQDKTNIKGGLAQSAIFGIITVTAVGVSLALNLTKNILNYKASKRQQSKIIEKQTFNRNIMNERSITF